MTTSPHGVALFFFHALAHDVVGMLADLALRDEVIALPGEVERIDGSRRDERIDADGLLIFAAQAVHFGRINDDVLIFRVLVTGNDLLRRQWAVDWARLLVFHPAF